jgi:chromatin-remodeling ATPase INO80
MSAEPRRPSKSSSTNPLLVKQEALPSPAPAELPLPSVAAVSRGDYESMPPVSSTSHPQPTSAREIPALDEAEVEAALARIETSEMNDTEGPGFEQDREDYLDQSRKRALDVDHVEVTKRKVCTLVSKTRQFGSNVYSDVASSPSPAGSKFSAHIVTRPNKTTT